MGLLTKLIQKRTTNIKESFKKKGARIDNNLPLNIKINSLITIDRTDFLLNESKITYPGDNSIVKAV